ncbi:unnamed protein product, partial [Meganyctiphanes norvegica]
MNSKRSFKIEFQTTTEAKKFIASKNTSIGGIQLHPESKEPEVDPTISQCWHCGRLNPDHSSSDCRHTKRCLKCNSRNHQFFSCNIPKDHSILTYDQKEKQYCIPCGKGGDHTSLDHRQCPTKRRLVQDRINEAREKRKSEENHDSRDTELIKKTIELTNVEPWPALQKFQNQQQQTSTIVLLALLDEKCNPGNFQNKLDQELGRNGLPTVQYRLEPNTAEIITNILCAANAKFIAPSEGPHIPQSSTEPPTASIGEQFSSHQEPHPPPPPHNNPRLSNILRKSPSAGDIAELAASFAKSSKTPRFIKDMKKPLQQRKRKDSKSNPQQEGQWNLDPDSIQSNKKRKESDSSQAISIPSSNPIPKKVVTVIPTVTIDPHQRFIILQKELKKYPVHLHPKAKGLMRKGVTRDRGSITVNDLIHMLNNEEILMDGRRKRELLIDAEIAQSHNYGDFDISVDLTCQEPMARDISDTDSQQDFP